MERFCAKIIKTMGLAGMKEAKGNDSDIAIKEYKKELW